VELGFETVGNASLIVHDGKPILVTDPWLSGDAYFGSWGLAYEIPTEQAEAMRDAPFVWFSHGHPDHLHPGSLPQFKQRRILVADHVGGRIASDLRGGGFDVTVLKDNVWCPLSERIKVMTLADYNQDSVLLVDVGGRLVVNLNDATDKGWGGQIRRMIKRYPTSFALRLSGYGDADMINFVDENGDRLKSGPELRKERGYQVGAQIARSTDTFGTRFSVPFSSFHRYQRTDSDWANGCTTSLDDMATGYDSNRSELLPAFIRYDCIRDDVERLDPEPGPQLLLAPEDFGDVWSDELSTEEESIVVNYFRAVDHVREYLGFIVLRVGGRETTVSLDGTATDRGITFEVPRHSLLKAIEFRIFDDLLIGNFMRTTLHGRWPASGLAADVTPHIAKYADNGDARTTEELDAYFAAYRHRMGAMRYFRHMMERKAKRTVQAHLQADSPGVALAARTYRRIVTRL
jgi:hypothetical protein